MVENQWELKQYSNINTISASEGEPIKLKPTRITFPKDFFRFKIIFFIDLFCPRCFQVAYITLCTDLAFFEVFNPLLLQMNTVLYLKIVMPFPIATGLMNK